MQMGTFVGIQRIFGNRLRAGEYRPEDISAVVEVVREISASRAYIEMFEKAVNGILSDPAGRSVEINIDELHRYRDVVRDAKDDSVRIYLLVSLIAAFFVEFGVSSSSSDEITASMAAYQTLKAVAEFGDVRAAEAAKGAVNAAQRANEAADNLIKGQAALNETLKDILNSRKQLEDEIAATVIKASVGLSEIQESHTLIRDQLADIKPEVSRLSHTVETSSQAIEAFKTAVRESLGQKNTQKLWSQRAGAYRLSFRISLIAILTLIIALPLTAFLFRNEILEFISTVDTRLPNPPADAQVVYAAISVLNRIMIFGLPIALYVWLIKYLIRFNQHNLLLAEDAAQRETMMETYYNLLEQNAAKPEDRELILSALFRPSIGQPSDNVELPLIEFIKAIKN